VSNKRPYEPVAVALKKVLNSHGYSFQNAIFRAINKIKSVQIWTPWVPEFPVEVNGQQTRIDLVLTNRTNDVYLTCECKRANPSLANWCFAKSSFIPDRGLSARSYMDVLYHRQHLGVRSQIRELPSTERIYQVAVEVKTRELGDDMGRGRGQIEEAATQVCRGLNGLIGLFSNKELPREGMGPISFLPVVITTAKLWTTETDLSLASLNSGELEKTDLAVKPVTWLWYQYHLSPALKHSVPHYFTSIDLRDILYYEFVRPIAIVHPDGLSEFLSSSMWEQ
jgi:hypothetical protein